MPLECATQYFATEAAWHRELLPYQTQMQADVVQLLPPDVRTVLDAGCGDGVITNALPESLDVIGLDMSRTALSHVTRKTVVGSVVDLPFADGAFDLVMCNDVLEHLDAGQRSRAVGELTRVARNHVLVSVPFREDLLQSATQCNRCGGFYHINHHTDSFDASDLRKMFETHPFECVSQTLSGDLWWRDPPETVALRRLNGIELAPTAAPVCPYCDSTETVPDKTNKRLSAAIDWLAAAQCLTQPGLVDHALVRTEIITLFRSTETGRAKLPPSRDVPAHSYSQIDSDTARQSPRRFNNGWQLVDDVGSPVFPDEVRVRNDRIDFRNPGIYSRPFSPRYGWLPYFTTPTEGDPRILRPGDRMLCGFFVGKEARLCRQAGLRIRGKAAGSSRLVVYRFNDPRRALFPKRIPIDGDFDIAFPCRPVPTRHGFLFILHARGSEVELESMTLDTGQHEERTLIDNRDGRARFLVNNSSPELQISLPVYGDVIDVEQVIRSADAPTRKSQPIPIDADLAQERVQQALQRLRPLTQLPGTPSRYRRAIQ